MRLLVLGGDAAGMTAASHVRRTVADAEIVVVERGPHTSYSMCGIPYFVGGEVDSAADLVVRTPEQLRRAGITVHTRTEATAIDARRRRVRVRDLATGRQRDEAYDLLLYAVGAHPVVPDVPGARRHGQVVHTLDEGEALREALDRLSRQDAGRGRVVVVGAGYIGMELAEALVRRRFDALLLDRSDQVFGDLDADLAAIVQAKLEDFGVRVRLGKELREVRPARGGGSGLEVVTADAVHPADVLAFATGAAPLVGMAQQAGCAVGASGALVVDPRMRTTVDRIWAAGDCVESRDLVTGRGVNVQLGTHANKQGKVAGIDIAARLRGAQGGDAAFPGVVGTAVTRVCDTEIGRTGITAEQAAALGIDCAVVGFRGTARSSYLPDPGSVEVKMVAERPTGRLLGAQLVGTGNVAKRIDVAASWIQLGVTVQDAQFLDLSYAPPFGSVWDLLQVGARKLVAELGLSPAL